MLAAALLSLVGVTVPPGTGSEQPCVWQRGDNFYRNNQRSGNLFSLSSSSSSSPPRGVPMDSTRFLKTD
ncbi:hypothetical protein JOB18_014724 [Solea senegalensis]|uniref:Secreted protein n=1 Tax=Solea senegalensis TaxID=28829 RepID=A0AAV6QU11_SOLSE|nr:hypothetical protein JOB18_014724 [Solea senegalensis]